MSARGWLTGTNHYQVTPLPYNPVTKPPITDMEITKRKLLSCQEEMKSSESDMFVHRHQLEEHKKLIRKLKEEVGL